MESFFGMENWEIFAFRFFFFNLNSVHRFALKGGSTVKTENGC